MRGVPFDRDVFVSNCFFGNLNVFYSLFRNILGNVLSEIFNGIVIGDSDFLGNVLNLSFLSVLDLLDLLGNSLNFGLVLVLDDLLLEGHVFDSAFTLNDILSSINGGSNNIGSGSGHCSSSYSVFSGSTSNSVFGGCGDTSL